MARCLFIALLLIGSLYGQTYRDFYSRMSVGFSEAIDTTNLFKPEHFTIIDDSGKSISIIGIGITENTPIITKGNKKGVAKVVLVLPQLKWGRVYTISVDNVFDLSGNLIDSIKHVITWSFEDNSNREINKTIVNSKVLASKLQIINAYAKDSTDLQNLPFNAYNGKKKGDLNSVIWTTRPLPEWIIFELSEKKTVNELKLSFSYFESGRVYSFTVDYSDDKINWKSGLPLAYSIANVEWVSYIVNFSARYIRINFLTNSQSTYAGLWEAEFYGR